MTYCTFRFLFPLNSDCLFQFTADFIQRENEYMNITWYTNEQDNLLVLLKFLLAISYIIQPSTRPQVDQVEYMLGVWSRLAEAAQQGARAVVLLLEPHHAALFLRAAAGLLEEGLLRPGDFVFLMEDSPLPYIKHEYVAPTHTHICRNTNTRSVCKWIYKYMFIYIHMYIHIYFLYLYRYKYI